ncbi:MULTISPECIES: histidine ammonia-lyase [Brevibacillus]|jgi:histidine ammonia-lyase|uniref:Histidine ammonia-lyase n=1 Tax=Brevibacillus parabrevis TaxID=54914 RepID=A0A4Y3PFB9_BREPA|nr:MULTISPECIES: histidine ammonia-lyase [Brevibacillus]MBU8711818.1 histidine ammonia-lyase [Brevibacillus parabrevis]NRQ51836.1 histidine ammonia-lyase [Brevibacillus sp. HD1.4A]RNB93480.1 histidine ammonia-lyase [Brevibacillus parabrevis]UED71138.1 histidine ammonia-lyase [Brevibacillus sp. HD3.3A]GEB31415.1 histidine ammonia-lyase 2 [Brevibacillus parabrevis]
MNQPTLIQMNGDQLRIEDVALIAREFVHIELTSEALENVRRSRAMVEEMVQQQKVVYGITTGFGKFSDVMIQGEDVSKLQENLIMSHACGMGDPYPVEVVRAMMALRINALAKGYSGIREETLLQLVELCNRGVHPVIPQQGSLGASGDLAPLAHMVLVMLGKGEAYVNGQQMSGSEALKAVGLAPIRLQAKEGLALINGTQAMTAQLCLALYDSRVVLESAELIASMTIEALRGIPKAFDPQLHLVRPHPGQQESARRLLAHLSGSQRTSQQGELRVQDPYSLRCLPQVHGATRDTLEYVWTTVSRECNSVTDNPILFTETGDVISGGNFHGQPMAFAADFLAIAMAELANISERRTERLVNPQLSGLPGFLTENGGLHSGFMITQYVAASIVSENKVLCHPASVDSIPSSANQEDHVSMGTTAARKLRTVISNVTKVLAIEYLAAAQAIDFGTGDLGAGTSKAYAELRRVIPRLHEDREMHPDLVKAEELIKKGTLVIV